MAEKQMEKDGDEVAEKLTEKKGAIAVDEEDFDDEDELGEDDLDEIEED